MAEALKDVDPWKILNALVLAKFVEGGVEKAAHIDDILAMADRLNYNYHRKLVIGKLEKLHRWGLVKVMNSGDYWRLERQGYEDWALGIIEKTKEEELDGAEG